MDPDKSLISLIEAAARSDPTGVALLVEDGTSFTYSALLKLADIIARNLVAKIDALDVDMGDNDTPLVSVMMNRHVGVIASILGVLKAGAAYVPVDPAYPPGRQQYIFSHSRCHVLIADEDCYKKAKAFGVPLPPTLVISCTTGKVISSEPLTTPRTESELDSSLKAKRADALTRAGGGLAYVLFTSGSTGNPKGVMVEHEGVVSQIRYFARELKCGPGFRTLGLSTLCFDISVLELFMTLGFGATLVVCFSPTQKDPFRIIELIQQYRVDVMQATPTTYEMMIATGWSGDPALHLLCGGEALRRSLWPVVANCRSVRNLYGPTETTIWVTAAVVPRDINEHPPSDGRVSIGTAIDNMNLFLAAEEDYTKLATGPEGELCIDGIGMTRGYIHAPDLTAAAFVQNPYGQGWKGGTGWIYRTGDLVRRQPDGSFLFVRRLDDQVKIDGFRIELSEIENVYVQHPAVFKCVCLVRSGRLCLWLLQHAPGKGPVIDSKLEAAIHAYASTKLTHYMIPKATVVMDKFPVGPSGKTDKKALPDPPPAVAPAMAPAPCAAAASPLRACPGSPSLKGLAATAAPTEGPLTMAEHVCNVFQSLRGGRPGLNATFAAVGVDSLGAILFIRLLSDSLGGVKIAPADVYASGVTIKSFSDQLHRRLAKEKPEVLKALGLPAAVEDSAPCALESGAGFYGGGGGGGGGSGKSGGGAPADSSVQAAAAFDEVVAANRALFEGLRGVFTVMVLYDHFHNPSVTMSMAVAASTGVFVVLSGFTTALQLRSAAPPPTAEELEKGDPADLLEARPAFAWRNFLKTRALGIFPILWLAMVLCAPRWHLQNLGGPTFRVTQRRLFQGGLGELRGASAPPATHGVWADRHSAERVERLLLPAQLAVRERDGCHDGGVGCELDPAAVAPVPADQTVECGLLYATAMQLNWRPHCGEVGPDDLAYASIIWNLFLYFALARALGGPLAARAAAWLQGPLSGASAKGPARALLHAAFNRTDPTLTAYLAALSAAAFGFAFCWIWLAWTQAKHAITFLPYFWAGVTLAGLCESAHWCGFAKLSGEFASSGWADWPWLRALPDLIFAAFVLLCLPIGSLGDAAKQQPQHFSPSGLRYLGFGEFLVWVGIPVLVLGYLASSLLVGGSSEAGTPSASFSRRFLESPPLQLLGYVSYTCYLFQHVFLEFYGHILSNYAKLGTGFPVTAEQYYPYVTQWFKYEPLGIQIFGMLALIAFCWAIQKFYQDTFVAGLYLQYVVGAGLLKPSGDEDSVPLLGDRRYSE